jgi:hypothetical protein
MLWRLERFESVLIGVSVKLRQQDGKTSSQEKEVSKKNAEFSRNSLQPSPNPQKTVENSSKSTKPLHFFYFHQFY